MAIATAVAVASGTLNFFNNIGNSQAEIESAADNINFLTTQYNNAVVQGLANESNIKDKYASYRGLTGAKSNQAKGFIKGGSATTAFETRLNKNEGRELVSSYINEMNKRQAIQAKIQNEQNRIENASSFLRSLTDTTKAVASGLQAYTSLGGKFDNPDNETGAGLGDGVGVKLKNTGAIGQTNDNLNQNSSPIGGWSFDPRRGRGRFNNDFQNSPVSRSPINFENIFDDLPTLQQPNFGGGY